MGLATVHANLRAAFRTRLLTLSDVDFSANRVAWEGKKFFPTDGVPYFAESFRAVASRRIAFTGGVGGTIAHNIQASVTLFFPDDAGTIAIERAAGAVMALFRPGVALSYGGDAATIADVTRSAIYDDGSRIACAVNVSIPAYTQS